MNLRDARRYQHSRDPRVRADARRAIDAAKAASRRRKAKSLPRRKAEAADDLAARARRARIRAKVMEREKYRCAVCVQLGGTVKPATDMHHVLSGPDRQTKETVKTCLGVCRDHHEGAESIHGGHLPALEAAYSYCFQMRLHEAAAALARRIEKVREARAFAAWRAAP